MLTDALRQFAAHRIVRHSDSGADPEYGAHWYGYTPAHNTVKTEHQRPPNITTGA